MLMRKDAALEKHNNYGGNYPPNFTVFPVPAHTLFSNSVQLPK